MQKTAYEMRISYWSSDVCSSDLLRGVAHACVASISVSQGQSRAKALSWEVRGDKTLSLNVPVAGAEAGDLVMQIKEHGVAEPVNVLLPVAQPVATHAIKIHSAYR